MSSAVLARYTQLFPNQTQVISTFQTYYDQRYTS